MFDELLRSGDINLLADKGPNGRANQLRATRFIPPSTTSAPSACGRC
jgi:hypothetical protein